MTDDILIEVKNLKISFGDLHVIKDLTTTIKRGEKTVVIGPSGSGKSTFLRCLNRLETPGGSTILFEGNDMTSPQTNLDACRQKMGMVFQHFNLFPHLTVLENITLAPVQLGLKTPEEARGEATCRQADGEFTFEQKQRQAKIAPIHPAQHPSATPSF